MPSTLSNWTRVLHAPDFRIAERWHCVYAKHPKKPYLRLNAVEGIWIVTAIDGSGTTLSFGLAERTKSEMHL